MATGHGEEELQKLQLAEHGRRRWPQKSAELTKGSEPVSSFCVICALFAANRFGRARQPGKMSREVAKIAKQTRRFVFA